MHILCVGGGPAGLYFGLLSRRRDPTCEVTVVERNRLGDTFGFGVVFSDATLERLARKDPPSHEAITRAFAHWGAIDIDDGRGEVVRSNGHGFAGIGRRRLLDLLAGRAREVGVTLRFGEALADRDLEPGRYDLVVAADGVNSGLRARFAADFRPHVEQGDNRFVWLGTTFPFPAFTFLFRQHAAGLFRVHAYRYAEAESTFIVECTADTFARAGLSETDEAATVAFCERLFARDLAGHRLQANRSIWRRFPTVSCASWRSGHVVLVGDAAHTAHFSIGSGTKLALEDAIALDEALAAEANVAAALARYEAERRKVVESAQRAAAVSLAWFEETERHLRLPPLTFAASLLTRSLRVTHENLALRDPPFVARLDRAFAEAAHAQVERSSPSRELLDAIDAFDHDRPPPPMLTPLRLRDLVLPNRVVVSPMCQYSAEGGLVGDWHLVHLGSRAIGGAGLVMAEMTAVSGDARITPGCAGIWSGEHATAWRRVVEFVHERAGSRIGLQLGHAGRKGATRVPWQGEHGSDETPLDPADAWPLFAPSPIPWREGSQTPRAMTEADMARVVAEHERAARFADDAGFDLLEVHAAHGYLLASFLSPLTNRRDDAFGGSVEGRLRFPLAVVSAVRAAWPAHKPLSVRISATDWAEGGTSREDLVAIARALVAAGVDLLDVSTGQTVPEQRPRYGRLYQTPFADLVRSEAGVPTLTVGAVSTFDDANSVLVAGRADLVALARGHLYDPYFTRHAAFEQGHALEWPAPYRALARYSPRPPKRA